MGWFGREPQWLEARRHYSGESRRSHQQPHTTMRATVKDSETSLSKSDTNVRLDGEDVTRFDYRQSTGGPRCPNRRLSSGAHAVEIEAEAGDNQGSFSGKARKRWIFTVA